MSIYSYEVKDVKGNKVSLKDYEGKVLLIVNTASKCGLTPQYKELEELYKELHDKGVEILDLPCNQFLEQAPGSDEEQAQFCKLNYDTTFKTFAKVEVNGENAHPLYKYLKQELPEDKMDEASAPVVEKLKSIGQERTGSDIKWNFGKFLIDRKGNPVARFYPAYNIEGVKEEIKKYL